MKNTTNIKMQGHKGTWYSIDARTFTINGASIELHLFEHETYGDEAAYVIGTLNGIVYMENVHNGWDDFYEYFVSEHEKHEPLTWRGTISI